MPLAAAFDLAPEEALAFYRGKGLKETFAWQDMLHEEHSVNFTVAKMLDLDLLADVKAAVDKAIAEGQTLRQFADRLRPALMEAGWWGRETMIDPLTGEVKNVQLGSSRRLQTIFETNMKTAYAAGHWAGIQKQAEEAPYLQYDAILDARTREEHAEWNGKVLPITDPWWNTHYPPNGWNCRCGVIQLDRADLEGLGKDGPDEAPEVETREWTNPRTGEVLDVPLGIDPGWGYNPGKVNRTKAVEKAFAEKLASAPSELAAAVQSVSAPEPFIPAQNLPAAQSWAEEHYAENLRLDNGGDRRFGSKLSKAASLEKLNEVNRTMAELREDFPEFSLPKVKDVCITSHKRGCAFLVPAESSKMCFSDEWADTTFSAAEEWSRIKGRPWDWTRDEGHTAYNVRHELAHVVDGHFAVQSDIEWKGILNNYDKAWRRQNVSDYAGTKDVEFFAETFAQYTSRHYERNRSFPSDLTSFLDKILTGVGRFEPKQD